jgi:hypothetical protein
MELINQGVTNMNRIKRLFLGLTAALWLLAGNSAHAATACSGVLSGAVPDGVVVNGGFCRLQGANVAGGVRVTGGAFVIVCASTINGGFAADGAGELIFGAEEIGCDGNVFNGAVRINNTGTGLVAPPAPSIAVERSTINGGVSLIGNQGLIAVAGNRISGHLFCSGNLFNPDDEGMKNSVSGQVSCTFK